MTNDQFMRRVELEDSFLQAVEQSKKTIPQPAGEIVANWYRDNVPEPVEMLNVIAVLLSRQEL
jgi:hypothetical protein